MRYIFIIFFFFIPAAALTHPSIAIKFDSKGNLYYSDLENVYKISPTGVKSVAGFQRAYA